MDEFPRSDSPADWPEAPPETFIGFLAEVWPLLLFPCCIAALMGLALLWQRKALRGQDTAIRVQADAVEDVKRSLELQREGTELCRRSLDLAERSVALHEETNRLLRKVLEGRGRSE